MIWVLRAVLVFVLVACGSVSVAYIAATVMPSASRYQTFRFAFMYAGPAAAVAFLAGAFLWETWQ